MPTVEKTHGGRVYIRAIGRELETGDRVGVDEEMATYLCEERGDFERLEGVTDATFTEAERLGVDLESLTYDELLDKARTEDISGRSSMDKAELIDALSDEPAED